MLAHFVGIATRVSFNRTSMESKHASYLTEWELPTLLIEPVWNRNEPSWSLYFSESY